MRYAQYFNKKEKRSGHLWQGRFFSSILDNDYLTIAARYVERNPVRIGLVKNPWDWNWSSALGHISEETEKIKLENIFDYIEIPKNKWKDYLENQDNEIDIGEIRKNTIRGLPSGGIKFVERLEQKLEIKIFRQPVGRPKKNN